MTSTLVSRLGYKADSVDNVVLFSALSMLRDYALETNSTGERHLCFPEKLLTESWATTECISRDELLSTLAGSPVVGSFTR